MFYNLHISHYQAITKHGNATKVSNHTRAAAESRAAELPRDGAAAVYAECHNCVQRKSRSPDWLGPAALRGRKHNYRFSSTGAWLDVGLHWIRNLGSDTSKYKNKYLKG